MCEHKYHQRSCHHRHHWQQHGYSSIVKRNENQVTVPPVLLDVAEVDVGDFLEITIRKVKKHNKHHYKE
jgi:hypothetical protein